ncbi:MAG: transcription-repair coupling factor [Candidatus Enteromonas sp.]|nr:transcription-repair coupling factor [Candidatus Enteromonas sp.]
MSLLLDQIRELPIVDALEKKKGTFVVEETLGVGLLTATSFLKNPRDMMIVGTNQYAAQRLYEFLLNFLEEENVVFFPSDELLRAEALSSSRELLSQRLYALGQLQDRSKKKILVTHPSGALRYLPTPKVFEENTLRLRVGETIPMRELKGKLLEMGYQAVNKVERSLQFASRGDILDVYSVSCLDPIRIEFFDDEIEGIRLFDVSTQEKKKEVDEVVILPASDLILSKEEREQCLEKLEKELTRQAKDFSLYAPKNASLLQEEVGRVKEGFATFDYRPEFYKYFGFAKKEVSSVIDYFSPSLVLVTSKDGYEEASSRLEEEARAYYGELAAEGRVLSGLSPFRNPSDSLGVSSNRVYFESFSEKESDYRLAVHRISLSSTSLVSLLPSIQSYLSIDNKVVLSLPDPHQRDTVIALLNEAKIAYEMVDGDELPSGKLGITEKAYSEGFEIPSLGICYLSSRELFRQKATSSRFVARFKEATVLRSYEDLKPGDFVVHEVNGIGKFLDIQTLLVDGVHRDYLHIEYADHQFLYVPLEQFRLVRKYSGREGVSPKLSSLSKKDWDKKKAKIKQRINELADRLIALYGSRARGEGFCFPSDDELQAQFESRFPYPLTRDQEEAVAAIKKDMESPIIMDRLVCGDVGFGKTEVAFRAIFKAILGGKQVALLCPTTLLCRQHFEVASERFAEFGIRIASFSRLVPEKIQKEGIEKIEKGEIDLAIGTHRLLSKDFHFKDLGLLVIDEEQRFGVEQKEKIKEMSQGVDVLTLSATPIPRTLQMSLVGIRPISEINTAPRSRMPIQTYVTPFRTDVVIELVERELARHGQVYYVNNRVESLYGIAARLSSAIPGAEVGVVHGQMEKDEIEEVMERFYDGAINVLVCTSIVENGIDVPNANMVIVENADTFGLSQLYQIKGRVGRGNRIAYAYLTYREKKNMNEDAVKRLQAIQEFTELGSGYKIAQRDLMIRGAGDMLGPEQAGFIDSVGLDLYIKLLNEAVDERRTGVALLPPKESPVFSVDAYIPGSYASKEDKIALYQELEDATSVAQVARFQQKMRDIYGKIPEEVLLLIAKKKVDLLAEFEEFDTLKEYPNRLDIFMDACFSSAAGIASALFDSLVPFLKSVKVSYLKKRLIISVKKEGDWLRVVYQVMKATHKTYVSLTQTPK